jgi:hypothetical protein
VVDIKATGGNVTQAMKVIYTPFVPLPPNSTTSSHMQRACITRTLSPLLNNALLWLADIELTVLLAHSVLVHAHQWLQQDGLRSTLLPHISYAALSASMPRARCNISWLDHLLFVRLHLPVHTCPSCIQSYNPWDVHQFLLASVNKTSPPVLLYVWDYLLTTWTGGRMRSATF